MTHLGGGNITRVRHRDTRRDFLQGTHVTHPEPPHANCIAAALQKTPPAALALTRDRRLLRPEAGLR